MLNSHSVLTKRIIQPKQNQTQAFIVLISRYFYFEYDLSNYNSDYSDMIMVYCVDIYIL